MIQSFFNIINQKSFETLSKHNRAVIILESFALNSYISTPLTNM